jgi:hypothetical protein
MDGVQDDDFAAFLQEAFQWTDAETPHNANVLFPSLHPSPSHQPRSSPFGGALFSALTQQQPRQQQQQEQQQQPHQWHAWYGAATAAGQPLLPTLPDAEQSAALSAQILHLQAQQQQQEAAPNPPDALHAGYNKIPRQEDQVHEQQQSEQEEQQQQQQQALRRGRPPKQPGMLCQGYKATMRSRQKQKAEVGSPSELLAHSLTQALKSGKQQQHSHSKCVQHLLLGRHA